MAHKRTEAPFGAGFSITIEWRSRACAASRLRRHRLKEWWPRAESNHRHTDFQSAALPTELLGRPVLELRQHGFSAPETCRDDFLVLGRRGERGRIIRENSVQTKLDAVLARTGTRRGRLSCQYLCLSCANWMPLAARNERLRLFLGVVAWSATRPQHPHSGRKADWIRASSSGR